MSYQSCVMKLVDNYFKFTLRNDIVICKACVMLSIIINKVFQGTKKHLQLFDRNTVLGVNDKTLMLLFTISIYIYKCKYRSKTI